MNSPFMPNDLNAWWEKLSSAGPNLQVRELFRFAYSALEQNSHAMEVDTALFWAEELQDRDASSETYGNFRWYRRNERPVDRNAVEFSMEVGVLIWMFYRDALKKATADRLSELIAFSIEGIRRHQPAVSYSNIYTMKMWNCIGIGENFPDASLAEEGYDMLDLWLTEISQNGIHEYVSPTYTPVTMACVENIARYTNRVDVKNRANQALRFCWLQLGAHWFPKCERLCGAHSRDYDYLGTGVRNNRVRDKMAICLAEAESTDAVYLPDSKIVEDVRKVIDTVPRTVCQKWGEGPADDSTVYVGEHFAIGSAGASYGPIDKCLTLHLGDRETANVTFFCDARGDFYGQKQFQLNDGHAKALHLVPFIASAQQESEVLFFAAPEPTGRHFQRSAPNPTCLLSHLIMPNGARIFVGEKGVLADHFDRVVPNEDLLIFDYGTVQVGMRFVMTKDTQGETASVRLVRDEEGNAFGVMRVTCEHALEAPTARGVVGLWLYALEGSSEENMDLLRRHLSQSVDVEMDGAVVDCRVAGHLGPMRLKADLKGQVCLVRDGVVPDPKGVLFSVNGVDVGRRIFE